MHPTVVNHVVHHRGVRYATLADPHCPWSAVVPVHPHEVNPTGSAAVFPQLPSRLRMLMGPAVEAHPQEHNAFYLNVTAPQSGWKLPVLVFIHGGAWSTGGGPVRWYHGGGLAASGVVVVTLNYRLGVAGHLRYDDTPHAVMDELILALQWVQRFIGNYGGDPQNVTVAGQSAGAWYAWALAQEPRASGLLQRVALWSLPEIQPWSFSQRRHFTRQILGEASEAVITTANYQALMQRGNDKLRATPSPLGAMPPMYLPAEERPIFGINRHVEQSVKRLHVKDVYIRHTAHEMTPFLPAPKEQAKVEETLASLKQRCKHRAISDPWPSEELIGDGSVYEQMVARATWESYGQLAEAIVTVGHKAGLRMVSRRFVGRTAGRLGSPHCFDLPFQFNNVQNWYDAPMLEGIENSVAERWGIEVRDDLIEFMYGESSICRKELGT